MSRGRHPAAPPGVIPALRRDAPSGLGDLDARSGTRRDLGGWSTGRRRLEEPIERAADPTALMTGVRPTTLSIAVYAASTLAPSIPNS